MGIFVQDHLSCRSYCEDGSLGKETVYGWALLIADKRAMTMKNLIKSIVQALVDNPEQVEVLEVKSEHVSVFELRVAKEDIGKVYRETGPDRQSHTDYIKRCLWQGKETPCP
jgi:hypothetical protein